MSHRRNRTSKAESELQADSTITVSSVDLEDIYDADDTNEASPKRAKIDDTAEPVKTDSVSSTAETEVLDSQESKKQDKQEQDEQIEQQPEPEQEPEQQEEMAEEEGEEEAGQQDPLSLAQQSLAEALYPYNVYFPPLVDENGTSRLYVKAAKSRGGQNFVNLKYNGPRQSFPELGDSPAFMSFVLCTPLSRLSPAKFANKLLPKGDLGDKYYDSKRGPELSWKQTDEALLPSASNSKNKAFLKFHNMLIKDVIPQFQQGVLDNAKDVFPKQWQDKQDEYKKLEKEVKDKVAKAREATSTGKPAAPTKEVDKRGSKTNKRDTSKDIELTDEERAEHKLPTKDEMEEQWLAELHKRFKFRDMGGSFEAIIHFKHRMWRPAKDNEKMRLLDPDFKSSTGDNEISKLLHRQAVLAQEAQDDPDSADKPKWLYDNDLPVFRCLTPAESEADPSKDSLIRMSQREVIQTVQPGDWVATLFSLKFAMSKDDIWTNPNPIALIWFAHHEEFRQSAMGVAGPTAIKKTTFALAQKPFIPTVTDSSSSSMTSL